MSETKSRNPLLIIGAVLLVAIALLWACLYVAFLPHTTAIRGDAGTAYFRLSGARCWISGSRWPGEVDEQRHYVFTTSRPDVLVRMGADTLEVFDVAPIQRPPDPDLSVPVRSVVLEGYELRRLWDRAGSEGLTVFSC